MNTVSVSRHFVEACGHGLGINERLIKEDQQEYHDEMKANYRDLTRELSIIMHEHVSSALGAYTSVQMKQVVSSKAIRVPFIMFYKVIKHSLMTTFSVFPSC